MKPLRPGIDVRERIERLLIDDDLEGVLRETENIVDKIFTEPLNTAVIFGDRDLDIICQKTGKKNLSKILKNEKFNKSKNLNIVFIVSRLQASGGHTALVADIAKQSKTKTSILVTGVGGWTNHAKINHLFDEIDNLHFEFAPKGSRLGKLDWLQRKLLSLKPTVVWLFNHHQDSVAISAVQPDQGYQLKYLHHGDHHLCLGVFLEFGEHYDPHPMGFHNCRTVLMNKNNRYLPLVIDEPQLSSIVETNEKLVTCTAAGSNKIEHEYWPRYSNVIAEVLAHTGGSHIHIGRLSWLYRYQIKRQLHKQGVKSKAFIYIPYVKSVASSLRYHKVDLYLASFPYAGARTLVEVMAAGVPTAGHDHRSSRILGAIDMLPPMSCVWVRVEQLIEFLTIETRESLKERGKAARSHYESYHTSQQLQRALEGDLSAQTMPHPYFSHTSDELIKALEKVWQFSIKGLISRWIKIKIRKIKSLTS